MDQEPFRQVEQKHPLFYYVLGTLMLFNVPETEYLIKDGNFYLRDKNNPNEIIKLTYEVVENQQELQNLHWNFIT